MNTDIVYGAFVDYYGNIPLTLIKQQENLFVYGVKVSSGLLDNKYIFVVSDTFLGPNTNLNNVNWISFQTRTTQDVHQVPEIHHYLTVAKKEMLKDVISFVERDRKKTEYYCELPIKITLIHDLKQQNSQQYPDKCLLFQALETYQCVVEVL